MANRTRILIFAALVGAVIGTIAARNSNRQSSQDEEAVEPVLVSSARPGLPRLIDLGKGTCIPCKKMAPVLEDLNKRYPDSFSVEYIDLRKDSEAADRYGVKLIPTQIFFDGKGKELFRHEGFFSADEIVAKWKQLGVEVPLDK